MTLYFSASTNGFYDSEINETMPSDAKEITFDEYQALLNKPIESAPLTKEQTIAQYEFEATSLLNEIANSWGYDSIISAVSYANSTNAQFKADAEALIEWRDEVWAVVYEIELGKLPKTTEDFVALLPKSPLKPVI